MVGLKKYLLFIVCFAFGGTFLYSQVDSTKQYHVAAVGFYNLENLHDTIFDADTNKVLQVDYTPNGDKKWDTEKYFHKLENLSRVISEMATEVTPDGLAILGISEIENKNVIQDLVNTEKLKSRNYQIVHYESPDRRGVDVGLIYNPNYFKVASSKSYTLKMESDSNLHTRDQLLVNGYLNGELVHIIVSHWPSRGGGEKKSAPKRIAAADLGRMIIDSLLLNDKNAKIIYMGDLNDDPINTSVKHHLKTVEKKELAKDGLLYNPMEFLYKKGIGTLAYRDTWNLFDQLILSPALVSESYSSYKFHNAKVFNKNYLKQQSCQYAGYPLRTHAGGAYTAGFSDHFPVYLFLIKEK
ncbi:MAG: endonuclease/exonuclease/phosphatase family protein [Flavobacteriales bacterium]|nr:endonuclease/exonuclease/phosphatase family protein [Flavobacteriales bacterium]